MLYSVELDEIVELPAGYFLLQSEDPAPEGYISVIYDDLTGYVKSSAVTAVDYTPVTKYEQTVKFTCANDGQPVNLRAEPKRNAEILTVLDSNASGRCYGSVTGEALIKDAGTLWYYVNANGTRGYLYYAHVTVPPTPPNIIEKEEPEPSEPTVTEPDPENPNDEQIPGWTAIIFIVALCIPVPFVMFYLFKKPKDSDN